MHVYLKIAVYMCLDHYYVPQIKMVNYMKAAFGDKLLTQPLKEDFDQLPSPEVHTAVRFVHTSV